MMGALEEIFTSLLPSATPEIRPVLLPKLGARCSRIMISVSKEPRIMASFNRQTSMTIGIRRVHPKSANLCHPVTLSLENFSLHRQAKAVLIPAWSSCVFEYANDPVNPPILNHEHPISAISITPSDEFNPRSVIIQPILPDRIDCFLRTVSCQKFFAGLLEFIQPFVAPLPIEIVGARLNKFDSDEITMDVELDEFSYVHFNEHVLGKIESALQAVRISRYKVSVLKSDVFEDKRFYGVTASIKTEIAYHSISTKIECWEDFVQLPPPSVHAPSHKNPLLLPPSKKPDVSPPITHGGQPRAKERTRRSARQESTTALDRPARKKSEMLCEQHGILWRFLDDNECELQNVGWQNEFAWFKLSGISLNRGRLVKYATNGLYLLVVPRDWRCLNIESPCFEFQQVEQLAMDDWSGYIIHAEHDETNFPRFSTPDAAEKSCEWQRTRFDLEGNCLNDAPTRLGPLYCLNPPKIKAKLPADWNEIGTMVLGEEGFGRKKAKWQLFPQGTEQIQDLLSKRIEQRSGWYFLRFYDREDNLIESFDFRFVTDLIAIDFPKGLKIPAPLGHAPQEIVLRHSKPLSIISEQHELFVQHISETETRLLIPPEPRYDSSEWCLDKKVPIKLELNRLWWCVADENTREADIEWQDKLIQLDESQFTATSSEALWLRIPKARIVTVEYGFRRDNPRKLPFAHRGGQFAIPLREFSGVVYLQANEATFKLWIIELDTHGTRREHLATLFRIKRKNFRCRWPHCSFVTEERSQAESHFRNLHPEYGFTTLKYSDAQSRGLYGNEYPSKIYQCGHNPGHFVNASSAASNPTSAITNHIEVECPDARAHANGGLPQIIFRPVEDVDEIRRVYLPTFPVWAECSFCNQPFRKYADGLVEDIFSHLFEAHLDELFDRK